MKLLPGFPMCIHTQHEHKSTYSYTHKDAHEKTIKELQSKLSVTDTISNSLSYL